MQLTSLLIPTYRQMLETLTGLLSKSESQKATTPSDAILAARLAPNMYPLSSQIRFAVFQALEATFHLRGQNIPGWLNDIASEGRNAEDQPGTMSEAKARISAAIDFLDQLDPDALDQCEVRPIAKFDQ